MIEVRRWAADADDNNTHVQYPLQWTPWHYIVSSAPVLLPCGTLTGMAVNTHHLTSQHTLILSFFINMLYKLNVCHPSELEDPVGLCFALFMCMLSRHRRSQSH